MTMLAIMVGIPLLLGLWLGILMKWQRGLWMLLLYLPFAGLVTLALRPSPIGTLLKDFLFVIPTYIIFFLLHTRDLQRTRVPALLTMILVIFAGLVLLQLFNPNIKRLVIGLVGVKVWLLYLPLIYLGAAFFQRAEDLQRVLRVCVAIAIIPCTLGIVEFVLSQAFGYRMVMSAIYGPAAAADATQQFAYFNMGTRFFRIPSTFSYVSQYSGYCLMMIPLTYMLQSIETEPGWRLFSRIMMGVVFAACMLSGARANFIFAPMLYATILFLDAKLTRMAVGLIFVPIVMFTTLDAVGLDVLGVFGASGDLAKNYGSNLVIPELIQSITTHPFGEGVGMNTGAALNLMTPAEKALVHNIEGYYSKAVIELGFFGMLLIIIFFSTLILYGVGIRRRVRDPMARSVSSAVLAFVIIMTIHSGKGWQIELDPINVWYYLLVGLMFQVPAMDFSALTTRRRRAETAHAHSRRPRRGFAPRPGQAPAMHRRPH